jgi:hypothetical protein
VLYRVPLHPMQRELRQHKHEQQCVPTAASVAPLV